MDRLHVHAALRRRLAAIPWRRTIVVLSIGLLVWLAVSLAVVWRLTHRAAPLRKEPPPKLVWAAPTVHRLTTRDGETLGAWSFAGRAGWPAVVLLHGSGGSRSAMLPRAKILVEAGYPVLAITLRAHGDSSGQRHDFGRLAAFDVIAAVEFLQHTRPDQKIVLCGTSLGSAAALFAADRLNTGIAGYILECPFYDLHHALANRTRIYLPPGLDWLAQVGLTVTAPLVLDRPGEISPRVAIGSLPPRTPVLILAGGSDEHAPPGEAAALKHAFSGSARFVVFSGGRHAELDTSTATGYRTAVLEFLSGIRTTSPDAPTPDRPTP